MVFFARFEASGRLMTAGLVADKNITCRVRNVYSGVSRVNDKELGEIGMTVSTEVLTLLLNIGLGAVCIALIRIFGESIFSEIAKFLFILVVVLMAHSAINVFLVEENSSLIYGVTALIASICYLLLVSAVYTAFRKMVAKEVGR